MRRAAMSVVFSAVLLPISVSGQSTPPDPVFESPGFGEEILQHFEGSVRKVAALAEAMPQSAYSWSPGEGVMQVGEVFMHIARYNFMYPETSLGIPAPDDLDLSTLESIRDKDLVLEILDRSIKHVRQTTAGMTDAELAEPTTLYGREVAKWAVLLQLVAHMNEHLGQSIAYARMNGVTPPWSM